MEKIQVRLLSLFQIGGRDKPSWSISKTGIYSSYETWNELQHKHGVVKWGKLLWFPLFIPKHPFISWLAIKNAITTGAKLLQWGFMGAVLCSFCRSTIEDHDDQYLFFQCGFSKRVWCNVMKMCR